MKLLYYVAYAALLGCSHAYALTLNDSGKISETAISEVMYIHSEDGIRIALHKARAQHLPIGIMGVQHSQGGQSLAQAGIQLDMLNFNKVLALNLAKQQVTVQSGITWSDLQKFINPQQLAITGMQSPNIFTVGGSVSVNAHGDDFRIGAVGNSIVSLTLLLADGQQIVVSPTEHPALWQAIRGGYGLFGVVTTVTLQLTRNTMLNSHYQEMTLAAFPAWFQKQILANDKVVLFYAHMNISPGEDFLQDLYAIYYSDTQQLPDKVIALDNPERWNALLKPLFNLSRKSAEHKRGRWDMEKKIFRGMYRDKKVTRNNAMEKPVRFAIKESVTTADWLQEYFIPVAKLSDFITALRSIMTKNEVNLLNVTIRYVPAENDLLLSQSPTARFAIVIYFEQNVINDVARAQAWTQQLVDAALQCGGTYYLTYQNFATLKQFHQAYPQYKKFHALKQQVDNDGMFVNRFYQTYFMATPVNP